RRHDRVRERASGVRRSALRQAGDPPQAGRPRHHDRGRALAHVLRVPEVGTGEDIVREVSMVKLFTAEMVNRVAYDCVQLHGGYGYMREYAVERFARDARLMTIGGGTSEIMRDIIAKALLP